MDDDDLRNALSILAGGFHRTIGFGRLAFLNAHPDASALLVVAIEQRNALQEALDAVETWDVPDEVVRAMENMLASTEERISDLRSEADRETLSDDVEAMADSIREEWEATAGNCASCGQVLLCEDCRDADQEETP